MLKTNVTHLKTSLLMVLFVALHWAPVFSDSYSFPDPTILTSGNGEFELISNDPAVPVEETRNERLRNLKVTQNRLDVSGVYRRGELHPIYRTERLYLARILSNDGGIIVAFHLKCPTLDSPEVTIYEEGQVALTFTPRHLAPDAPAIPRTGSGFHSIVGQEPVLDEDARTLMLPVVTGAQVIIELDTWTFTRIIAPIEKPPSEPAGSETDEALPAAESTESSVVTAADEATESASWTSTIVCAATMLIGLAIALMLLARRASRRCA